MTQIEFNQQEPLYMLVNDKRSEDWHGNPNPAIWVGTKEEIESISEFIPNTMAVGDRLYATDYVGAYIIRLS